ncbi:MAG TPA: uracil-DNA glycosylase [Anaerolineales bacterium]|nr:uracil-DNA glycosylase [Anaerolineales bacterium]HRQ91494.1 uracil-DNA glycosylase [Anaerolineales bacterium]
MDVRIEASWKDKLAEEFEKPYFAQLANFVRAEYKQFTIYPPGGKIFNAFDACPFDAVKVVILGQDPYHGPGQANGLSFSVNDGVPLPPSLQNIYKEMQADLGSQPPASGDLARWAEQGVLLLNATLTVRRGAAASHQGKGWEEFTDAALHKLSQEREHLVFILWGAYARRKGAFIDRMKHLVLEAAHPSPLSAHNGFFGSQPFSKTNAYLQQYGIEPVEW